VSSQQRVVFLGDSITQQGGQPEGWVTLVRQALAEAGRDGQVEIINAGISGNKVPDLLKRLDSDVLRHRPTLVVIYIGINDVWHSESGNGTPRDVYEAALMELLARIQAAGAKAVLCTPSVIGESKPGANRLDAMLHDYVDVSRGVAARAGTQLLDLHKAFRDHIAANNPTDAPNGILTRDGVHLNEAGDAFVARQMLGVVGG
jgi:lysophospholipase L1-like esterase